MKFRAIGALVFGSAVTLAATPALATTTQCPSHVDVRNLMTVTQYDQAGLNKLDKQQIESLNAWLSHYIEQLCAKKATGKLPQTNTPTQAGAATATTGSSPPPTPPPVTQNNQKPVPPPPTNNAQATNAAGVSKPEKKEPGNIETRIDGEFYGWTGNTVFRLQNGQVWKQAGPGYFRIQLKNPQVVIKKLLIGYVLLVKGYSREVFVRRVR